MSRNLGKLGQGYFEKLCHEVGLKVNPSSTEDSTGWDFVVELPNEYQIGKNIISYENDFSKNICKFQIKSSGPGSKNRAIKLSNLKRFTHELTPAFFIFFEYDLKNEPKKCFLVHVDEPIIAQALKKLRQAESKKRTDINKIKVLIDYNESHILEPITGEVLIKKIKHYLTNDSFEYAEKKKNIIKTTGFKNEKTNILFSVTGKAGLQNLVDCMLGIKEETQVQHLRIEEFRFGIKKEIVAEDESQIKLKPSLPEQKVEVFCEDNHGSEVVRVIANFFTTGTLSDALPIELKKIRLRAKYIDAILAPFGNNSNLSFHVPNGEIEIFEYYEELKFFFECIKYKKYFLQDGKKNIHRIPFEIKNQNIPEELKESYRLVTLVVEILKKNQITKCHMQLNLAIKQRLAIDLISTTYPPIHSNFMQVKTDKPFTPTSDIAFIFQIYLNLNEWKLGIILAISGDTSIARENEFQIINMNSFKIVEQETIKSKTIIKEEVILKLQQSVVSKLEEKNMDLVIIGNQTIRHE